jgi:uncharacterized protein YggE
LALTLSAPGTGHAGQNGGDDRRTIAVNGHGEVNADPDLATLSFAVETTAPTAARAVEQNAATSVKVSAALKGLLGADDKLKTTRYSLQPRYDYETKSETGEPKILGYVASNEVQVETATIDAIGKLIDVATTAGANRVNNLSFTVRDRGPHVRKALAVAGAEAKAQAEAAAQALGVKLKQVVSASTMAPPIVSPHIYDSFRSKGAAMAQAATPVEPGEVTVSAELNVVFEIE